MTELKMIVLPEKWIVGIIDAEGCFNVHIFENLTMKVGKQVQLRLIVTQKDKDEKTLKAIGYFFGAEDKKLTKDSRDETLQITIQRQELVFNKIIPFFQDNPLLTVKRKHFELWVECAEIMKKKEHTKAEGLAKIEEIEKRINLKEERTEGISSEAIELHKDWVLGFLEGDGSLILDIWDIKSRAGHEDIVAGPFGTASRSFAPVEEVEAGDSSDTPNKSSKTIDRLDVKTQKYKVSFRLEVGLHSQDSHILRSLDNYFGNVGRFNTSGVYPHWSIRGIDNCHAHVLPFFEANLPIFPKKNRRFALWKEALVLCHNKKHLTQDGADRLVEIYNTIHEKKF